MPRGRIHSAARYCGHPGAWQRLDDEARDLVERALGEAELRLEEARAAGEARRRVLARQLLADPAFDVRPSAAKRRFLAGELFPDESRATLDAVSELAENIRWLAAAQE